MTSKPNSLVNEKIIKSKGFLSMKENAIINIYDDNDAPEDLTKEPSESKRLKQLSASDLENIDNMDNFLGTEFWLAYSEGVLVATSES